jgi:molybdate transport system substrate-binding protein
MPTVPRTRRGLARKACALLIAAFLPAAAIAQPVSVKSSEGLLVFAAASLRDVLQEIAADWSARGNVPVRFSFAGTPALARQLEQGAPADLFLSADERWMDWARERGLVRPESVVALLGNRLVLVAPSAAAPEIRLAPGVDLGAALGPTGRMAIADVASVPAGRYGKAALESLGAWESVRARLAMTENVRAALALAARGEVPLAVVYESDARREPKVRVVGVFPDGSHPPIRYPMALTGNPPASQARAFHAHLRSAAAARIFAAHGFTALP